MKHKITNENIMSGIVEANIQKHYPNGVDICYTDPPWGNGNLNYWKTINKRMSGLDAELITQEQLEDRIVYLITRYVKTYAFIIYGKRESLSLTKKFKQCKNVKGVQLVKKRYKSGSKWLDNYILCITLNDSITIDFSFLNNQDGLKSLDVICEKFKGKVSSVLELFVGVGYYLKVLDKWGYEVVGNELNAKRLQIALQKVQ